MYWSWPWVAVFLAIYTYAVPWIQHTILERYWIHHDWSAALPAFETKTAPLKVSMILHMTFGGMAILVAPFQFLQKIRRRFPRFHRWNGRFYIFCGIVSSLCGNIFIALRKYHLVGGMNMVWAFTTAGTFLGLCSYMCYHTAVRKQFQRHRAWTIRSVSQIWAPMLYRYWYAIIYVLGLQKMYPGANNSCDEVTETCPAYFQIFDRIHCWTYWISSWVVAELIILTLPSMKEPEQQQQQQQQQPPTNVMFDPEGSNPTTALITSCHNVAFDAQTFSLEEERGRPSSEEDDTLTPSEASKAIQFNIVGVSLAVVFVGVTFAIYFRVYSMAKS